MSAVEARERATPRMRWLLGASLAVNLFLAAFVAAQYSRSEASLAPLQGLGGGVLLRQIASILPAGDAAILRAAFAAHLPELARSQGQVRDAVAAVRAEVERQPPDAQRLRAAIAAARAQRHERELIVENVFVHAIPQLSEPGRQALARYRIGQDGAARMP